MSSDAHVQLRWPVAIVAALTLVAVGAMTTYVLVRSDPEQSVGVTTPMPSSSPSLPEAPRAANGLLPDVTIVLSEEAIKGAGLVVAAVEARPLVATRRLPAVVEPNAYKQVIVTPIVSGRITRVLADLGARVQQGQTLATVFSPELAEAQTRFIAASAQLAAHERELARTEQLVQIGSASRQELERVHAEHTAQRTMLDSARASLELLGMSRTSVDDLAAGRPLSANTDVPAPITGIVTERTANAGLNVEASTRLFTVVDLSTVWIVANLYDEDLSRVRVGDRATVRSSAYPDLNLSGSVDYIDPQVNLETRTAKLRIEVANPRQELRLGMLADVQVETAGTAAGVLVPTGAVQHVADRAFVYLPKPGAPTEFVEREVRLGTPFGDHIEVLSGLAHGELIVVGGSFFLRAERERLGVRSRARM